MVSRGTNSGNSIETKDYLVTYEPFVVEEKEKGISFTHPVVCLLYTSPSPRDGLLSRMPSSA